MLHALHLRDQLAVGARDPADAQSRQPVGLRHHAERQPAFVTIGDQRQVPRAGRAEAVENLVVQKINAMLAAQRDQRLVAIERQNRTGRVVREVDRHQPRVRSHRVGDPVDVERPAVVGVERHAGRRADRERQGFVRLVIRRDDDRVAATVEDHRVCREDALARAGEAQHVAGVAILIQRRDRRAQVVRAEGLGIAQPQAFERVALGGRRQRQQIAQREALGIRRGQVIARLEFPLREVGFEPEIRQHGHMTIPVRRYRRYVPVIVPAI